MKTEYLVIDETESVTESIIKDLFTFGFLLFCIYVSHGSRTWTFISGCMFLLFLAAKTLVQFGNRAKKFKSLDDLEEWVKAKKADTQSNPVVK